MATLAIIFLHTNNALTDNAELFMLDENQILLYSRGVSMMCWALPCFMMITGALLLSKEKHITVKYCLTKYVLRMGLALFIFGIPFSLMSILFETKTITVGNLLEAVLAVLQNQSWGHLWYIYMLIGAYLLLPILKKFTENCTKIELLYVCGLLFFVNSVIPILNAVFSIKIALTVWLPVTPCFYLLIGHFINEYHLDLKPWIPAISVMLALTCLWILSGFDETEIMMTLKNILHIFIGVNVFIMVNYLKYDICLEKKKILWRIDRLCFGVYLVHPLFIHLAYRFIKITPVTFGDSYFVIFLFFVIFSCCSFALSGMMALIKPLKKHVL